MDFIGTIVWGVLASTIASFIFWILTFRISRTKLAFSSVIEKSINAGEYRYRVKLINSGKRDLIEVSFLTKIEIKRKYNVNFTYLGLGNDNMLPILHGKGFQKRNSGLKCGMNLTLYTTQTTLNEFKKPFYFKEIRQKAENGKLSLDDILSKYGEKIKITIFAYGYDSITGARKMFQSNKYGFDNIEIGRYNNVKLSNYKHNRYKKYVIDTLRFNELVKDKNIHSDEYIENAE